MARGGRGGWVGVEDGGGGGGMNHRPVGSPFSGKRKIPGSPRFEIKKSLLPVSRLHQCSFFALLSCEVLGHTPTLLLSHFFF
jgi:hypothetical protein